MELLPNAVDVKEDVNVIKYPPMNSFADWRAFQLPEEHKQKRIAVCVQSHIYEIMHGDHPKFGCKVANMVNKDSLNQVVLRAIPEFDQETELFDVFYQKETDNEPKRHLLSKAQFEEVKPILEDGNYFFWFHYTEEDPKKMQNDYFENITVFNTKE